MTRAAVLFSLTSLVLLIAAQDAAAQLSYISINSPSTISENFDSIGSSVTAQLPIGWRIGTDGDFALAKSSTNKSAGTSGVDVLGPNSAGGLYNFANGENATSTDRSVGFLSDASFSIGNKSLFAGFINNTGSTITELHLSYDIEKYRSGIRAHDIRLFYASDGIVWTEIVDASQHYDADATTTVVNPPTTISKSIGLSNLSVANQSNLYLRWLYTAGNTNGSQALGIDNFQLNLQQPDLQWDGGPGATWDVSGANWKNQGGSHIPWNDNVPNNASFVDGGSAVTTVVTLPSPRRAGRIIFDAGSKSYTLSGSSLQLTGAGGIGIVAKSNALIQSQLQLTSSQTWDISSTLGVSGPLVLGANVVVTKIGSGTVSLTGPQAIGANSQIKVSEGVLRVGANLGDAARMLIQGNASSIDALVILDSDQDLADLNISASDSGHEGLNLSSPSAPGAFRSLRIHAPDLAAAKGTLNDLVRQARLTPGDGIYDSSVAIHPNSSLGIAAMASGFVLIRPTRIGDINLDGAVTISDFIDLATNFGRSGATWQEGDLNYDGSVTISDFIDLASNFGGTYAGDALPISAADQLTLNSFAAAHGIAVPEPAFISILLLASLASLRLRRLQFAK